MSAIDPAERRLAISTELSAAQITGYRHVTRSLLSPAGDEQASPLQAFVVSHPAFTALLDRLLPGAKNIVHLQQELSVHRPMVAADIIHTVAEVTSLRAEPQGSRITIDCVQSDHAGLPVAELRATVLLKGHVPEQEFDAGLRRPPALRAVPGAGSVTVELTPTTAFIDAYAAASGDHNPIHTDAAAARQAGFPGPIAHGMSCVALACEIAADRLGNGNIAGIRALGARFATPVLAGEPLSFVFSRTADAQLFTFAAGTPRGPAIKAGWLRLADQEAGA